MDALQTFVADTSGQFEAAPVAAGYRAVNDTGNRRQIVVRSLAEDRVLKDRQRRRLIASGRDLQRNFPIAAWAVRKHLDYVSNFRFRATTKDEGFNREYEAWCAEVSQAHNFDLAKRHSRESATRLMEGHRFIDGDAGWAKFALGQAKGRCELIEGDRICNEGAPLERRKANDKSEWINGVEVDVRTGAALSYAVADRTESGLKPGRVLSARNVIMAGYYDRYDQVRGVPPWASSIDTFKDVDEAFEFTRLKVKMHSLAGIKFKRTAEGPLAEYVSESYRQSPVKVDLDADPEEGRYDVDLSGGSVFGIDLDRGDDAEFMESQTPATQTVEFLKLCVMIALRSCDIPYSFFDESFTNFYGQRGCFLSYLQGVRIRQQGLIEALNSWMRWRAGLAVADGSLQLPSGWEYSDLSHLWLPVGQPWWDPSKEITATALEISLGLNSPQNACHELNRDFERNVESTIDAIAYVNRKAAEKNVAFALSFDASSATKGAMAADATGQGATGQEPAETEVDPRGELGNEPEDAGDAEDASGAEEPIEE
jgi:capsid protein